MNSQYSIILSITYFISFTNGEDVVVDTNLGKISGKVVKSVYPDDSYYSFLGIPYAQPPIEELRFMAPKPHPGWEDVLDCKQERKACPQLFIPAKNIRTHGFYGDEDCLFLNVHTPKMPIDTKLNLPVIVFLINEQFKMTINVTKEYGPDFFMKEDVIVVTVNHRLASLGFLCFEDDLLPGNNGLRDVILALKWIQENVRNFGGDPTRITLMGSQGGAVLADMLLYSKKAKGLFHRVILQSGTSWNAVYFSGLGRKRAQLLVENLEWSASTSKSVLKFLKNVNASDILNVEHTVVHADEARAVQRGFLAFSPVVEHEHEDAVITKLPELGPLNIDIPIMIGYNSREVLDISERYLQRPQFLTFADRDFLLMFPIRTGFNFRINDRVYFNAVQEVKDFYFEEGYVKVSKPGEFMNYMGDAMILYPIDYTVRKYSNESSAPVYYYTFDYSGEWNFRKKQNLEKAVNFDGTWGASVTDELCYLFVCNRHRKMYETAIKDEESEEFKVLQNMVKLWTNFAKTGNPTPPGEEFTWTPATAENKECLLINEDLEIKTKIHEDRIQFWDGFIEKNRQKAIDGEVRDFRDEL